jgi:hypothetical protein
MAHTITRRVQWAVPTIIGSFLLAMLVWVTPAAAQLTPIPEPDPIPGSYGLEATKPQEPPEVGARISTPASGASFTTSPISVSGICPDGLLVQVYNNGVMVGAVVCENGSFRLDVSLFAGVNELTAIVFDELDQTGPASNTVTVNYNDTNFTAFGELITLTSSYGRRSAPAGNQLSWPLQLSGGTGPYAFSIDWGDGSSVELKSQSLAGVVSINHVYKQAGIHRLNVRVTDSNGVSAFLQTIAVANGQVDSSIAGGSDGDTNTTPVVRVLWIPAAIGLALLIPTFWLGRRSQVVSLRNKMLKDRDSYQD